MVVELPQAGRRHRRSRARSGCRSSTPTPRTSARGAARTRTARIDDDKRVQLGDLLPVRLTADGNAVDARAAAGAAGRAGRDGAEHRPRRRARRRLRLGRVAVRSRDPGAPPGRLVDQAVDLRRRDRGRPDAGRRDARRPVLGDDRDRRVDAGELRQQVHGPRHADDRARLLAQHDHACSSRCRSASIASSRSCAASASRRRSRATSRSASARPTSRRSRSRPATPASRTAAAA